MPQSSKPTSTETFAQPWKAVMASTHEDKIQKKDTINKTIRLKYQADDSSLGG